MVVRCCDLSRPINGYISQHTTGTFDSEIALPCHPTLRYCTGRDLVGGLIHQRNNPYNAPKHAERSASLSLPLSDWLITVENDPTRRPAEVVAGVINQLDDYVTTHGLHGEVAFVDTVEEAGAIAIRCSARLEQIIEEFPEVSAIRASRFPDL